MIDRVDLATIDTLAERSEGPWVSIYLPTERLGSSAASKIRLKNLLAEARTALTARGTDKDVIRSIVRRGESVLADDALWHKREIGLAVFFGSETHVAFRMAVEWDSFVVVADAPDTDQLRAAAQQNRSFAVLGLSLDHVRFLRGDQLSLTEDDPSPLPVRMADVLSGLDREPQLQSHSSGRVAGGATAASFHGQEPNEQADIDRFLHAVDRALGAAVDADLPVVLAGIDRIVADFRRLSHHRSLLGEAIHGNVDRESVADLHRKAWAIVHAETTQER